MITAEELKTDRCVLEIKAARLAVLVCELFCWLIASLWAAALVSMILAFRHGWLWLVVSALCFGAGLYFNWFIKKWNPTDQAIRKEILP